MTKLLERGIEAVSKLPPDEQDLVGEWLLELAGAGLREYVLTPEQIEDVKKAIEEADRGEFATDEEVEAVWRRFGL
jgi:hypothetical protein